MKFFHHLRALVYPERCPYCGCPVEPHEIACADCLEILRQKHLPLRGGAHGFRTVASFVYAGRVRRMIIRIKFRERTQYIPQVAAILVQDIREAYGENSFDCITAVPMYKQDQRERGYNQSELLAKALGQMLNLPYTPTLIKIKRTKKQHRLNYTQRKKNLSGAFQPIDKEAIRDQRILLIDDIITTGHTLGACAKVLARCKPAIVCCAAIAASRNDYPEATVI